MASNSKENRGFLQAEGPQELDNPAFKTKKTPAE
tara:strand:- start:9533 stop:9634 length:102 start_codon:yes stop_codon:yes gene_type:complete